MTDGPRTGLAASRRSGRRNRPFWAKVKAILTGAKANGGTSMEIKTKEGTMSLGEGRRDKEIDK